jgi:DNA polymerase I-like protein with 3'-5' exonuclease and polymerase domains
MSRWLEKFIQKTEGLPNVSGMSVPYSNTSGKIIGIDSIMSGLSVPHPGLLAKSEEDLLSTSGVSVPHSGISAEIEEDSLSTAGLSVPHPGISAKNEEDLLSTSGVSVANPSTFPKNKDSIETTGEVSSLLQRWKKKSAEMNLKFSDGKEDDTILKLKAEPVGVKDDQAAVDALTLPLQQTIIAQHDKAKPAPASEDYPTDIAYQLITDVQKANDALNQLVERQEIVGLDLETTGLFPHEGAKARLLQVSATEGPVLVIDLFQVGGLRALKEPLQKLKAVAHNAVFEMKFLKSEGVLLTLDCTLLAHHILTGKMAKLSDLCTTHLMCPMDKTLQTSDWTAELTADQLKYAAADAYYTRLLFEKLAPFMKEQGSEGVYTVCKGAQQTVVDMELAGMPFDAEAHQILLEKLIKEREGYKEILNQHLKDVNLNSGKQLGAWLTKVLGGDTSAKFKKWPKTPKGNLSTSEKDFKKGLTLLPKAEQELITGSFLPYKEREKQITSFGDSLLKSLSKDTGRIHANFQMTGTRTGRFSCSNPNLQQIPRDKVFRALFKAPQGRTFVIADYSQMELRVAAIVANEEKLLEAYREGKDTHAITAAMLLNKKPEEVTKQERQLAKAVNFGLLYGQGAKGLKDYASSSYGVEISEEEARQYREAWFKAYPTFASWHRVEGANSKARMMVTTPLGRKRRFVSYKDRDFYSVTKAYNTPIQGGAAEVMLAALGRLSDLLLGLDAKAIAVIHDEVIVESSLDEAPKVIKALEDAMVQGMLDVFPEASTLGLVEAHVADSWADK